MEQKLKEWALMRDDLKARAHKVCTELEGLIQTFANQPLGQPHTDWDRAFMQKLQGKMTMYLSQIDCANSEMGNEGESERVK